MRVLARIATCLVAFLVAAPAAAGADTAVAAGTRITNTATATYGSSAADTNQYAVASNTIVTIVAAVTAVGIGPSESGCNAATDGVDQNTPFVRTFTVSNNSNVGDAYAATETTTAGTITQIVATAADGTQTPLAPGAPLPQIAAGQTMRVAISVSAKSVALGTDVEVGLTVRSTVANASNGDASANASQCAILAGAASFAGVDTPAIPKLVDGAVSEAKVPGDRVTYTIAFRNTGGVIAQNSMFSDPVPTGIVPIASSASLNGIAASATVANNTIRIPLGNVAPGATIAIAFDATVGDAVPLGTSLVNIASISADNVATLQTNPAAVMAGYDNVVYDGYGGQSMPVGDAVVTAIDATTHLPISLTNGSSAVSGSSIVRRRAQAATAASAAPASGATSVATTPQNGTYDFSVLLGGKTMHFEIDIVAAGYRNRRIDIVLKPDPTNTIFTATLTALDGQLLAHPGDFKLEPGPVVVSDVYGVFGNLPLFRNQAITLTKTVDRQVASAGDRLTYTLTYANVGVALGATTLVDALPPGLVYAPHTSRLDGKPVEPAQNGRRLTWTFAELDASHTITLSAIVAPGVAANTTLTNLATIASGTGTTAAGAISASANAITAIVDGIFSDRTVLTGRVYIDARDTGTFVRGDSGVAFVRLFLESGESVLTDGDGRFSFPGVKPGMHVLRLDTSTLPPHVRAFHDRAYDSERSTRRLIHGIFDGGVMQDANFAVGIDR